MHVTECGRCIKCIWVINPTNNVISTECWPNGTTIKAASSGPKDCPKLPPT